MSAPAVFQPLGIDDAIARAKVQGKLVLIDFTADWCAPCKQMDATTWRAPEVEQWVAEHAIAVQIDVEQRPADSKRFEVQAMPTLVLLRDGAELDRTTGGRPAAKLLEWLEAARHGHTEVDQLKAQLAEDDPSARLHLARVLQMRGKLLEALEQLEWCWFRALDHEPAWIGVKHSFLANQLAQLAKQSVEAHERIRSWRDALDAKLGERASLVDWLTLNDVLEEPERTLAWFETVKDAPPPELKLEEDHRLVELLEAQGRWNDLGRLFGDPVARLNESAARFRQEVPAGMPEEVAHEWRGFGERALRQEAAMLVRALKAAGREAEAAAVRAKALELDGSGEMRAAVDGAGTGGPA